MKIDISSRDQLEDFFARIDDAAAKAVAAANTGGTPIDVLRRMKFETIGFHPVFGHALNLIEQVNQTFTFLVALQAVDWLLDRHPEARGFRVAPGAHASLPLDIMSIEPDLVGAETFAAVRPDNNDKLRKDLAKLAKSPARHRYAFFYSPGFPVGRVERLERELGIEVHCIDINGRRGGAVQ
jgi:hypothetical protein